MIGTWRWNVVLGLAGAALTILFSIGKNPLTVMLLRSVYAFIAFVIIAFILRAVLAFILRPPTIEAIDDEEGKGKSLDLSTPDESDDINQMLKSQLDGGTNSSVNEENKAAVQGQFRPLNPPQLLSAQSKEPEELAKVVRHMTGG
ncbi:MAG: hypothetical protein ACE3L7_01235 [Candidatus Pristimantibacillus sp.]